jgi:HPt (histidine-containing phosphotransfer) domain-containing protein
MGSAPEFTEALNQLWRKFLPQIRERIAVLEEANRALQDGALSAEQQAAAGAAAHKLAGVLGTFSLAEGTTLAREAEEIYASSSLLSSGAFPRLEAIAERLADLIQIHP